MSDALLQVVTDYIDRNIGTPPFVTPIPGVTITYAERPKPLVPLIFKPALCVVLQGCKSTYFGGRRFDYGAGQALVVSVEMPAMSQVTHASPTLPHIGIVIEFDLAVMQSVLEKMPRTTPKDKPARSVCVSHFDGPLSDCVLRMMRLLHMPEAMEELAPLTMREMCYWLLAGPHGDDIAHVALATDHTRRVIDAIHTLRREYTQTIRVESLAAISKLSVSAFHRQFKAITSLTPLQYQKQLRLMEAQKLLLSGNTNAEMAALAVGYESPSQFSREYSRMFGAPPRRSVENIRHGK
jgi:AraC-like DNA-binding protein